MMYCHVLQRIMSMSTTWVFRNTGGIVQDQFDLVECLTDGGNAYGNATTAAVVLEH